MKAGAASSSAETNWLEADASTHERPTGHGAGAVDDEGQRAAVAVVHPDTQVAQRGDRLTHRSPSRVRITVERDGGRAEGREAVGRTA